MVIVPDPISPFVGFDSNTLLVPMLHSHSQAFCPLCTEVLAITHATQIASHPPFPPHPFQTSAFPNTIFFFFQIPQSFPTFELPGPSEELGVIFSSSSQRKPLCKF